MHDTLQLGVHPGLGFADYRALEAWGSGSLRAMRRGPPARVLWERDHPRNDTDATRRGTAAHCQLLTPALCAATYARKPDGMSFATRDGKAWRDDPERVGKVILSYDEGETVDGICRAVKLKQAALDSLADADFREASLLWECSMTGERCKGRPDWVGDGYVYDLKVSRSPDEEWIAHRAHAQGWFHQLAHYRTGLVELGYPMKTGRLVVVDPEPPHFVLLLEAKADALDLCEMENIETLRRLRACRESGHFPDTSDDWTKIEPPARAGDVFSGATEDNYDELETETKT